MFLLSLPLVFAAGLFVYNTVTEIDLKKITSKSPPRKFEAEKVDKIESESLVLKKDLEVYWSWLSGAQPLEDFIALKTKKGTLEENKDRLFFKDEYPFPSLLENDCLQIYCLQSRLSFSEIPSILWRGLIGIEDYRFLDHPGIDPKSLARALWHDLKVGRLEQGGSTLTQQLAKNLFYTNEKKFSRKFKEMIASAYIEMKLSKEEILQAYFNEVMWGSLQGIKMKGVGAAASMYFKKPAEFLTPYEASILISLLKGPYYYSPIYKVDRLKDRVKVVFNKLKTLQLFPEDAYQWNDKDWKNWNDRLVEEAKGVEWRSLYLLSRKPIAKQTFSHFVFLRENETMISKLKEDYPKADFAIKTILLNIEQNTIEEDFRHYSKIERDSTAAFDSEKHQVGSTIKPLIYGLLVESGYDLEQEIDTTPINLKLKSGDWSPRESHDGIPDKVTLKTALVQSLNRPVVRLVQEYGFDKFEEKLKEIIPRLQVPLNEFPAQLLGTSELSLSEFSKIYGDFVQKACWTSYAKGVLDALSDPTITTVRYRVGEKMGQMRFFGKTGTTNLGFDTWFVGFNGKELLMVWVGLESGRDTQKELKIYGSNSSFLVYKNYYQFRGRRFDEMACQEP